MSKNLSNAIDSISIDLNESLHFKTESIEELIEQEANAKCDLGEKRISISSSIEHTFHTPPLSTTNNENSNSTQQINDGLNSKRKDFRSVAIKLRNSVRVKRIMENIRNKKRNIDIKHYNYIKIY